MITTMKNRKAPCTVRARVVWNRIVDYNGTILLVYEKARLGEEPENRAAICLIA